jgi:hypothetical protein
MPSKIQVDQIAGATGSTVTLPSGQTLDLSSGTVTLPNSAVNLTTKVTGTLPVANGGTGLSSLGTANQELRVNSGATALEFYTPTVATSDFVKIHSTGSVSGNTISVDGYFSATYKNYIVKVLGIKSSGFAGNRFNLRVNTGGSTNTASSLSYATDYNNSSSSFSGAWSANGGQSWVDLGYVGNTGSTEDTIGSLTINFFDPQNTNNYKPFTYEGSYWDGGSTTAAQQGGGSFKSTTALTGFTFGQASFAGTGTIYIDDIIIYGLK